MSNHSVPRVMIVESYGSNMKAHSSHIESMELSLQVLSATDSETAMERLERESVDLVIIDACLRGKMDGFELCRAIRSAPSDNQHLPIILLLAGYLSLERFKGIAAGADLLLHKPVVREELSKMIELLLKSRVERPRDEGVEAPEPHSPRPSSTQLRLPHTDPESPAPIYLMARRGFQT